jgi:predicted ATPase
MQASGQAQVIMATHSPLLMACPGASLIRLTKYGHQAVRLEDTEHFRVLREFFADPELFVASMVEAD